MKLSRALKEKNRVCKQIAAVKDKINKNNSTYTDNEFVYDIKTLWEEYHALITKLVNLKVAIQTANQPVLALIYKKAELQGQISLLKSMDTREGTQASNSYHTTDLHSYKSQMSQTQVDTEIDKLQDEINKIQDELDEFNATTTVKFE